MKKATTVLLALVVLSAAIHGQTTTKGLEGTWNGALDAGGQTLHLILTVTKSADGSYSGKLDSVDQGAVIPVDVITVNGQSVHLELKSIEAKFDGKLNGAATELSGEFSQGGATLPLTLKRAGEAKGQAAAEATAAKPAAPQKPLDVPAEVTVPIPPTAFKGGGGKTILCYELHVTNFSRSDIVLTRAEAISSGSAVTKVASYDGDDLAKRVLRPGVAANTTAD